jgi:hypothetical protein
MGYLLEGGLHKVGAHLLFEERELTLRSTIPHQIVDSIWLTGGSLLIGAGHLMCLYGQTIGKEEPREESLFEHVARHNGPLDEYHPQMILQCLLWGTCFWLYAIFCSF